jgi:hypothetical protein
MTDEGLLKRFTEQIDSREAMIMRQRDAITRLLTAVRVKDVPETGTVVKFKLDPQSPPYPTRDGQTGLVPYLRVKESYVDGEGVVIVELEAMD